jgi:glucosamine--fructose-6-phosphate aminotransferase (isomerizing)
MTPDQNDIWNEIHSQPDVWRGALLRVKQGVGRLRAFWESQRLEQIIFTGCGATYHVALAAAAVFREVTRRQAYAMPAAELAFWPATAFPTGHRTLFVPISRSGAESDVLQAVKVFREHGYGSVLTFSCNPDGRLARSGDVNITLPEAQEKSEIYTRSLSTLYLATILTSVLIAERPDLLRELERLPDAGKLVLKQAAAQATELGRDERWLRCHFLGSHTRYGLATALAHTFKTLGQLDSEGFYNAEYAHGPQAFAHPSTLLIGLLSDSQRKREVAVLEAAQTSGARCVVIGGAPADVVLTNVHELVRGPLYLPFGQLLAYERAVSYGFNLAQPESHVPDTLLEKIRG